VQFADLAPRIVQFADLTPNPGAGGAV